MTTTRGPAARLAMIRAAEEIAADRGLRAVSLHEVQARAGQANKSAAAYHFGSKEGLLRAALDRGMEPVNRRREALLRELGEGPLEAPVVARALVEPLAVETLGRRGSRYARFLLQLMVDPTYTSLALEHLQAASFQELRARFTTSGSLPADLADVRFASAVGMTVTVLATWEAHGVNAGPGVSAIVADLIETCAAALSAPAAPAYELPDPHDLPLTTTPSTSKE